VVLYVTQARAARVAAYRVGANGKPAEQPFQQIDTGTDSNPRRLAVHPNACALYVATGNTIEVFQIAPNGRLSRFDHDDDTLERMRSIKPANYQFLTVHPDGHSLYTALTALDQIRQYALNPDGSLRKAPGDKDPPVTSCVQGNEDTRYQGLVATPTHLYASSHVPLQVDIFPLASDGGIETVPNRPNRDEETPEVPSVVTDCERKTPRFAPMFSTSGKNTSSGNSKRFGNPKTLLLDAPNSLIYVVDRFRGRIYGCPIGADGGLPDCPKDDKDDTNNTGRETMKSKQSAAYEQMTLSEDGMLFASVFPAGRVRAFRPVPDEGKIKRRKGKSSDVFATPVALATDGRIMYVAQGELDRIDAFAIDDEGFADEDPRWSTDKIDGTFPNGVIIVRPNPDPLACAAGSTTTTTTPSVSTSTASSTLAATTTTTSTMP
jgi:6-phosphogluconolactonase (cycloisomerase 2 family)